MNNNLGTSERTGILLRIGTLELRCRAVCFDLDGVLADSHDHIDRAVTHWAASRRIGMDNLAEASRSLTDVEFVRMAAPHLDPETEAGEIQRIEYELAADTPPMPGALELYRSVPKRATAIVTSGSRHVVTRRLRSLGIPDPNILISADDVTAGKPAPEPYRAALRLLDIHPDDAIAIEDTIVGATSAKAAGMSVIGVGERLSRDWAGTLFETCVPTLRHVTAAAA
ncbi:HAD family hydrolase [Actinokineospora iranica]|uniref:Sugar-phosphatase n=1 Tax=Actinokineospora iranica TaxID=1271860 RepID=A0A1G6JWL7_9PSEU|nr:HAD-IA family hydrolase [Actinokineospora iranica]SDC22396.1 sugar-phosphatase [Actinokineospora iranica]